MDCKVFRQEFEALNAGEQPSATAQAHVNSCMACRTFQSERLSLRQLIGSLGAVNAPPDFDFRLRARLAAAKSAGGYSFHRNRFAPGLKAITVAASFALLITAAIVFKQSQPAPVVPSASEQTATTNENEGQAERRTDNNSVQLAAAPKDNEAAPLEDASNPSGAGEASRAVNRGERLAQGRHPRNSTMAKAPRPLIISSDSTLRGNPTVVKPVGQPATANTTSDANVATPLRVSSEPVRILLHDRQGAMRSVSLERVVFGSQSFLERPVQRRAVASDAEGIW